MPMRRRMRLALTRTTSVRSVTAAARSRTRRVRVSVGSVILANQIFPPGFEYRITAKDAGNLPGSSPAPQFPPYWVTVTKGVVVGSAPVITHNKIVEANEGDSVFVSAKITDADNNLKNVFAGFKRPDMDAGL